MLYIVRLIFLKAFEGDVLVEGQQPGDSKDDSQQSKGKDEKAIGCQFGVGLFLILSVYDLVPSDSDGNEGDNEGLVEDYGHVVQQSIEFPQRIVRPQVDEEQ